MQVLQPSPGSECALQPCPGSECAYKWCSRVMVACIQVLHPHGSVHTSVASSW